LLKTELKVATRLRVDRRVPDYHDPAIALIMWRPFNLDHITLWICDVDRITIALGTVAGGNRASLDTIYMQMVANAVFIEWFYPKAEMIQIVSFFARSCAASPTEFAIYGHQIEQRATSTELNQTDLILTTLDRAAEHLAVEANHAVEVDNAEDKMVDFPNM
jgi:hypothetical protein